MPFTQAYGVSIVQLTEVFAANRYIIRERASEIREIIEAEPANSPQRPESFLAFTLRDEANTLCALAFRNGPIEDIHASVDSDGRDRITDQEMKQIMIAACQKLAELLRMKEQSPEQYYLLIRRSNQELCEKWER